MDFYFAGAEVANSYEHVYFERLADKKRSSKDVKVCKKTERVVKYLWF